MKRLVSSAETLQVKLRRRQFAVKCVYVHLKSLKTSAKGTDILMQL
jgi:hypothetical protein